MKRIVTIGGGTGSFAILRGLRDHPIEITAVVNIFDSGGSSGVLRDEFGVLPPGDVRRALLALSSGERSAIVRELFTYRFNGGTGLSGHNFGNLLLVALSSIYGSDVAAIGKAAELLDIKGTVLPVSLDKAHVHALLENGDEVVGETNIDIPKHDGGLRISRVFLDPPPTLYAPAKRAIEAADVIVVCPGDLYSSLVPTLLTAGMSDALHKTKAKIVWVANTMTKWGETDGFAASDFARELLAAAQLGSFDAVVWNTREVIEEVQEQYAKEKKYPVQFDEPELMQYTERVITGDLLSKTDLVRLDSAKVAEVLVGL